MDSPIASTPVSLQNPKLSSRFVPSKQEVLLERLRKYYSADNSSKATIVKNVVSGNTVLSLRIIDWFVTNYSRDFDIKYLKRGEMFCVYSDYKSQLKAFSKKMFDPFCRRQRENIPEIGETTIGQLNFFKWAIECGIIEYAIVHVKEIEQNMISSQTDRIIRKSKKTGDALEADPESEIPTTDTNTVSSKPPRHMININKRVRKINKKPTGFLRDDIDTVIKFN